MILQYQSMIPSLKNLLKVYSMKKFMWQSEWDEICPKQKFDLSESEMRTFDGLIDLDCKYIDKVVEGVFHTYIDFHTHKGRLSECKMVIDEESEKITSQSKSTLNAKYEFYKLQKRYKDKLEYYKDKIVDDIPANDYSDIIKFINKYNNHKGELI